MMKKYLVTAQFEWNDGMMRLIPAHREVVDDLIADGTIEHYAVSMEIQTVWITLNAKNKRQAKSALNGSPLYKHWKMDAVELMVWDGQLYRLPALQMN